MVRWPPLPCNALNPRLLRGGPAAHTTDRGHAFDMLLCSSLAATAPPSPSRSATEVWLSTVGTLTTSARTGRTLPLSRRNFAGYLNRIQTTTRRPLLDFWALCVKRLMTPVSIKLLMCSLPGSGGIRTEWLSMQMCSPSSGRFRESLKPAGRGALHPLTPTWYAVCELLLLPLLTL